MGIFAATSGLRHDRPLACKACIEGRRHLPIKVLNTENQLRISRIEYSMPEGARYEKLSRVGTGTGRFDEFAGSGRSKKGRRAYE
jgi:hypothetical protein